VASIRRARADDAPALASVHVQSWQQSYAHILPADFLGALSVERRQTFWEDVLSDADSGQVALVVAQDDAGIVGFALAGPARETQEFDAELYAIYLLADYQRRGYGFDLVRELAKIFAERNLRSMMLWVFKENAPARAFYESMGGVISGEQVTEIGGKLYPEVAYGWSNLFSLASPPRS
jgi:ribosomal protein S18 acetylase RimI-like enzyme